MQTSLITSKALVFIVQKAHDACRDDLWVSSKGNVSCIAVGQLAAAAADDDDDDADGPLPVLKSSFAHHFTGQGGKATQAAERGRCSSCTFHVHFFLSFSSTAAGHISSPAR